MTEASNLNFYLDGTYVTFLVCVQIQIHLDTDKKMHIQFEIHQRFFTCLTISSQSKRIILYLNL